MPRSDIKVSLSWHESPLTRASPARVLSGALGALTCRGAGWGPDVP